MGKKSYEFYKTTVFKKLYMEKQKIFSRHIFVQRFLLCLKKPFHFTKSFWTFWFDKDLTKDVYKVIINVTQVKIYWRIFKEGRFQYMQI